MARTTLHRISRRSIEAGMKIRFGEDERGIGRFTVVRSVEHVGEVTRTVSVESVIREFTNDDVLHVVPAEGEIWA